MGSTWTWDRSGAPTRAEMMKWWRWPQCLFHDVHVVLQLFCWKKHAVVGTCWLPHCPIWLPVIKESLHKRFLTQAAVLISSGWDTNVFPTASLVEQLRCHAHRNNDPAGIECIEFLGFFERLILETKKVIFIPARMGTNYIVWNQQPVIHSIHVYSVWSQNYHPQNGWFDDVWC